jgi:hypothetical protein
MNSRLKTSRGPPVIRGIRPILLSQSCSAFRVSQHPINTKTVTGKGTNMKNDEFTQLTLWTEGELADLAVVPTKVNPPDPAHEVGDKQQGESAYTQLTLEGLWA